MNTEQSLSPFDFFAKEYDAWYDSQEGKIFYENEKKCIAKLLNNCGEVLEVGVGTARFAVLADQAVGIDIAFTPLKIAQKRGIPVIQAKAEELPFRDKSFQCVMFIISLSFIKDIVNALLEAKRILKEDGKMIICDVFKESELGKFYEEKKRKGHPFYSHATFYEFSEFKEIIGESGLSIKKVYGNLKKSPLEAPELESPIEIENFEQLPGFVCIEVSK